MANCKLDRSSIFDCVSIVQAGIGLNFWLINFSDFKNATITENVNKEITNIVLPVGTYAYRFDSVKGSENLICNCISRQTSAKNGYAHSIEAHIFESSQVCRDNLEKLSHSKVVAIIPLISGGYLLYGRYIGMQTSEFEELPGDASLGDVLRIVMETPEYTAPENHLPQVILSSFDVSGLEEAGGVVGFDDPSPDLFEEIPSEGFDEVEIF